MGWRPQEEVLMDPRSATKLSALSSSFGKDDGDHDIPDAGDHAQLAHTAHRASYAPIGPLGCLSPCLARHTPLLIEDEGAHADACEVFARLQSCKLRRHPKAAPHEERQQRQPRELPEPLRTHRLSPASLLESPERSSFSSLVAWREVERHAKGHVNAIERGL